MMTRAERIKQQIAAGDYDYSAPEIIAAVVKRVSTTCLACGDLAMKTPTGQARMPRPRQIEYQFACGCGWRGETWWASE